MEPKAPLPELDELKERIEAIEDWVRYFVSQNGGATGLKHDSEAYKLLERLKIV